MTTHVPQTVELGDLIVAAFDEAAIYSTDPEEVSSLATQAIAHMLRVFASPHAHGTHYRMVA